jgi:hypothetical protein
MRVVLDGVSDHLPALRVAHDVALGDLEDLHFTKVHRLHVGVAVHR